jgi:hypothetical protein
VEQFQCVIIGSKLMSITIYKPDQKEELVNKKNNDNR